MLTHEEKQIHNAVHVELREFEEFKALVKRMREAQKERDSLSSKITFLTEEDTRIRANSIRKTKSLESEVDEYLNNKEFEVDDVWFKNEFYNKGL